MSQTNSLDSHAIETEEQLIVRAQSALSSCNWEIGECAAQWTQKYSKGRTDADFGALIGLSGDQVYQRRRVWETFADVHADYTSLKWSHFYVSINWDDSAECLQWANEMEATVAEMKAWRRAQNGEDLSQPADEEPPFQIAPDYLVAGAAMVRDPAEFGSSESRSGGTAVMLADGDRPQTAMSAAREAGEKPYAPFGEGARGPMSADDKPDRDDPTPEQIFKRATSAIERAVMALSPQILEGFHDLPLDVQQKFLNAVENLQSRAAGLA